MTLAITTSSPSISVALLGVTGQVLGSRSRVSTGTASETLAVFTSELLDACGASARDLRLIAVDIGPGSYTGLRVGVVFAKSLAWSLKIPVVGIEAFDLISDGLPVAIPFKKSHWIVRDPGGAPQIVTAIDESEYVGYGAAFQNEEWPKVDRFSVLIGKATPQDATTLMPFYATEPSVSIPKDPRVLPRSQ